MNKIIHKFISLILIVLIILLVLDFFSLVTFSSLIRDSLYFATLVLVLLSSTSVICSKTNNLKKFINYIIIIGLSLGIFLYIIEGDFNTLIYFSILLTLIYSISDMLYKTN